jgi:hypothetical protein
MEQGRITLNGVGLAAMIVEFKDGGALIKVKSPQRQCSLWRC